MIWLKFLNWYYSTTLGGLHLEFLLWWDRKNPKPTYYLNPGEVQQIIRQYSLLDRGVTEMKHKVNALVRSKSKEEYHNKLTEIENLVDLAQRDPNSAEGKFAELLKQTVVRKNKLGQEQDVLTATDRAKMIDKKINQVYELQDHVVMRNKLREIRKLRTEGKNEEADKLFKEWNEKYGRQGSRHRRS